MTSKDMTNATFSQELEGGATRSDSPDGPMIDLFGAPVVPARRSPSPASRRSALSAKARVLCGALEELVTQYALTAKTLGLPTPDTYGRKFGDSQLNLDLDAYSESRLTQWEHSRGSLLYQHHLKYSATPLGRRVCRLQASARPISDSDCGGWPTPNAISEKRGGLQTNSENALRRKASGHMLNLDDAAQLAGWATPTARDTHSEKETLVSRQIRSAHPRGKALGFQALSFPATTTKRGLLNPAFSLWLMGYPRHWMAVAPSAASASSGARAMQSFPNAQPNLSEPGPT